MNKDEHADILLELDFLADQADLDDDKDAYVVIHKAMLELGALRAHVEGLADTLEQYDIALGSSLTGINTAIDMVTNARQVQRISSRHTEMVRRTYGLNEK